MAILSNTTLSPGNIERAKDPLNVALAMLRIAEHIAEHTLQMEEQQGYGVWRRGQGIVIKRARGEVYRALGIVEMLIRNKNDLPKEALDKIKGIRSRFPKCPQA